MDKRLSRCKPMGSVDKCDSVWYGVTVSHSFEDETIHNKQHDRDWPRLKS